MSKQLLYSIHASKIHKEVMSELKEKDIVLPGKSIQSIKLEKHLYDNY